MSDADFLTLHGKLNQAVGSSSCDFANDKFAYWTGVRSYISSTNYSYIVFNHNAFILSAPEIPDAFIAQTPCERLGFFYFKTN